MNSPDHFEVLHGCVFVGDNGVFGPFDAEDADVHPPWPDPPNTRHRVVRPHWSAPSRSSDWLARSCPCAQLFYDIFFIAVKNVYVKRVNKYFTIVTQRLNGCSENSRKVFFFC